MSPDEAFREFSKSCDVAAQVYLNYWITLLRSKGFIIEEQNPYVFHATLRDLRYSVLSNPHQYNGIKFGGHGPTVKVKSESGLRKLIERIVLSTPGYGATTAIADLETDSVSQTTV